ncbi:hypothetical protein Tco_1261956 [Tanacetum coccineum]
MMKDLQKAKLLSPDPSSSTCLRSLLLEKEHVVQQVFIFEPFSTQLSRVSFIGFPVENIRVVIMDSGSRAVDSSEVDMSYNIREDSSEVAMKKSVRLTIYTCL